MGIATDYEYPKGTLYYCICEECKCKEEVDYVDQVCSACYVGSHQEEEHNAKNNQ